MSVSSYLFPEPGHWFSCGTSRSLTPAVSGRRPHEAVQVKHIRQRAAVTSTSWLGSVASSLLSAWGGDSFRSPSAWFLASAPAPRITRATSAPERLTPQRTASGQTAALRVFHIPNVAAMRWRGLLARIALSGGRRFAFVSLHSLPPACCGAYSL
jgi:hypothetical protein